MSRETLHSGRFLCDVLNLCLFSKGVIVPPGSLKGRNGMIAGTNPGLLQWLEVLESQILGWKWPLRLLSPTSPKWVCAPTPLGYTTLCPWNVVHREPLEGNTNKNAAFQWFQSVQLSKKSRKLAQVPGLHQPRALLQSLTLLPQKWQQCLMESIWQKFGPFDSILPWIPSLHICEHSTRIPSVWFLKLLPSRISFFLIGVFFKHSLVSFFPHITDFWKQINTLPANSLFPYLLK